ncbi:sensor histidine kinase [uncultured Bosea sp.]|uniref:sensor histidine kinase n=1 Tax=uncultured Bosea sp. TaxID=211457 RepID=UPI0025CD6E8C|nr:histidine kinase [uncultured Bosea sp.]
MMDDIQGAGTVQHNLRDVGHSMMERSPAECAIRQAYIRFGLVYWGGAFLSSAVLYILKILDSAEYIQNAIYLAEKFLRYGTGWLIATAISYTLFRLHGWARRRGPSESSLPIFIVVSFLISLAAAPVWAAFGYAVQAVHPLPQVAAYSWNSFINDTALGAAMFFGWSCLFISLIFSFELHDRGRRLAAAREEALSAQMRALRYQVNPHFLFNTLNSIAGLIEEGAATQAERMVLSLSTFLRTTLSLDPMHDVPLVEEISLQEGYLEIERQRFSDRMAFSIDVPADVHRALVPSLILQPLIENAIKHGVGATAGKVEIALRAQRDADRLRVTIENDMPPGDNDKKPDGMGVGLRNVAQRLRARFEEDGHFSSGTVGPGRYRASLDLPWRLG